MAEKVVTYAQNREDVILSAFFLDQPKGFYVDVGANDPVDHSVTKYFYDRGWRGMNIEPNPVLFKKIVNKRPDDINLNIGISSTVGALSFREYEGHGLSTFSEQTKKELAKQGHPLTKKYKDYEVPVKRLADVIAEAKIAPDKIDFLKVDVEGYEFEVIESNDWSKYRPRVICIEANHIQKDWPALLRQASYEKVFNDGLNDYYVDSKRPDLTFKYIDALIGRDITPAHIQNEMVRLENHARHLEDEVRVLRNQNLEYADELEKLTAYILDHSRLRTLVKDLVFKIDAVIRLRLTNKFKGSKRYPGLAVNDDMSATELLRAMRVGDARVFARGPSVSQRIIAQTAKYTYLVYRFVTRGAGKIVRRILKLARGGAA